MEPNTSLQGNSTPSLSFNIIGAHSLRNYIKFLSSNLLEGRETGSKGEQLAVEYLENQMLLEGLETFRQSVPLVGMRPICNSANIDLEEDYGCAKLPCLTFSTLGTSSSTDLRFSHTSEYIVGSDYKTSNISIQNSRIIFGGYCINSTSNSWNDFKNISQIIGSIGKESEESQIDSGIILMCLVNEPSPVSEPNLFHGKALTYYGRWTYKIEEARRQGFDGIILIHTTQSAGYPFSVLSNQFEQIELATDDDKSTYKQNEDQLLVKIWINEDAARNLADYCQTSLEHWISESNSRDFIPHTISASMSLSIAFQLRYLFGINLIGILKSYMEPNEYVLISAHHDHIGKMDINVLDWNSSSDSVYNGAEDNASGLAILLGCVKTLSNFKKRNALQKNIVFLSLTGEELGLLGAYYYTSHPLFPLSMTVVDINFDIGNVHGQTRDISAIFGSDLYNEGVHLKSNKDLKDPPILQDLFKKAVAAENLYLSADPNAATGTFFRSDAFAFAKAGLPTILVSSGQDFVGQSKDYYKEVRAKYVNERYHKPSDEYNANWSMDGLLQQLQVALQFIFLIP